MRENIQPRETPKTPERKSKRLSASLATRQCPISQFVLSQTAVRRRIPREPSSNRKLNARESASIDANVFPANLTAAQRSRRQHLASTLQPSNCMGQIKYERSERTEARAGGSGACSRERCFRHRCFGSERPERSGIRRAPRTARHYGEEPISKPMCVQAIEE